MNNWLWWVCVLVIGMSLCFGYWYEFVFWLLVWVCVLVIGMSLCFGYWYEFLCVVSLHSVVQCWACNCMNPCSKFSHEPLPLTHTWRRWAQPSRHNPIERVRKWSNTTFSVLKSLWRLNWIWLKKGTYRKLPRRLWLWCLRLRYLWLRCLRLRCLRL